MPPTAPTRMPETLLLAAPTVRVLPPAEWSRLARHEPFATTGLPSPDHWRIIVAEVGLDIVGFTCLYEAVHMEPLWVAPEYRLRPHQFHQLLTDLWTTTRTLLAEAQVRFV